MKRSSLPIRLGLALSATSLALTTAGALAGVQFAPPFKVEAAGKPIDVEVGHAAPLVTDFDGDGTFDLLVGQFGDGKLRIYRNTGTATAPKFGAFAWFQAGGETGKVPAG
ncbi:MAG: VCBS repeat-containing protein [Verrucomicrobia bacterium]|nr:VCBS repeat-containing protein [Verrucomicrobiota bacterium]